MGVPRVPREQGGAELLSEGTPIGRHHEKGQTPAPSGLQSRAPFVFGSRLGDLLLPGACPALT